MKQVSQSLNNVKLRFITNVKYFKTLFLVFLMIMATKTKKKKKKIEKEKLSVSIFLLVNQTFFKESFC